MKELKQILAATTLLLVVSVSQAASFAGTITWMEVWRSGNIAFRLSDPASASTCNGQFILNIARRMVAVAVSRFTKQIISLRRRFRIIQYRLIVTTKVTGKNDERFLAAYLSLLAGGQISALAIPRIRPAGTG